jgi:hypothetical protein
MIYQIISIMFLSVFALLLFLAWVDIQGRCKMNESTQGQRQRYAYKSHAANINIIKHYDHSSSLKRFRRLFKWSKVWHRWVNKQLKLCERSDMDTIRLMASTDTTKGSK